MEPETTRKDALKRLREPFPDHLISKLPKPTKVQTEAVKKDFNNGVRCKVCGGWHHKGVVHLDYVGHADLTSRLLEVDPEWDWQPLGYDSEGMPLIIGGGMWIKLTVCGITRLGYGDAQGKSGHNAIKEIIGDALRNAGMRFGIALDLWSKSERIPEEPEQKTSADWEEVFDSLCLRTVEDIQAWRKKNGKAIHATVTDPAEKKKLKGFLDDNEKLAGEDSK